MKKVFLCLKMPHGTYQGGVASMVNSYMAQQETFAECGVSPELFDYEAPAFCEKLPSKLRNVLYGFLQRRAILRTLRHCDASAVHIHTSCQFLYLKDVWLAKEIKRLCHVPVYITVHVGAAETVFHRIAFTGNQTIRWINHYVDKVIFLGNGIFQEFLHRGMSPEKGTILGNFHDLADCPPENQLPAAAKLHLLFVGAIHRDKGILELLTAVAQLPELDVHLDICGQLTDQSLKEEFDTLVSKLGHRVALHGYVRGSQKTSLFLRADALVLPSYHEGFPLVILEALAGSCAVISTQVGATPEILGTSNALWVAPKSSDDIKVAIQTLYSNPRLLDAMKKRNFTLSQQYSITNHIRFLCRIYGE